MKNVLIVLLLICFTIPAWTQEEDKSYTMYETIYLKPKMDKVGAFIDAVKSHNEKYHAEAPYQASLQFIATGPKTGYYIWAMGPTMFSHLDDRPAGEHDKDWADKVVPNLQKVELAEYWILNDDLSYTPEAYGPSKLLIQNMDIARGEYYRFKAMLEKVKKVYVENKYDRPLRVYDNRFQGSDGRDVAFVIGFDSWSFFDDRGSLKKDYDEMYGEGAWEDIGEEWEEVVQNFSQEVREIVK